MNLQICPSRKEIIDSNTHMLVTGGPGCGKTTIALKKAIYRVEQGVTLGQQVLFLSFSRAAVKRILESAKYHLTKEQQKKIEIQTFHSFFWTILKQHSYLLGVHPSLSILLSHEEKALRRGEHDETEDWLKLREKIFINEGKITFDLFAPKALEVLMKSVSIRTLISNRYPLIIIDEAQDTGTEQWGCVEQLAKKSQILALADLDQQIYDFRSDVSPERLNQIVTSLEPMQVDLGIENMRSPDCEVIAFGNDILYNTPRKAPYVGVKQVTFIPSVDERKKAIRSAVGIVKKMMLDNVKKQPENIGYLTNWGKGVSVIAEALQGNGKDLHIPHQVTSDDIDSIFASKFLLFLLEPIVDEWKTLSTCLKLISNFYKSKKNKLDDADKIQIFSEMALEKNINNRAKLPKNLRIVINTLIKNEFSGNIYNDINFIRSLLEEYSTKELKEVLKLTSNFFKFQKGKQILNSLIDVWEKHSCYEGACSIVDRLITSEHLFEDLDSLKGINVMTMHKSKGKEFDCVIIMHLENISPFTSSKEKAPYIKSRRLLRVAITRARHAVLLITDRYNYPIILKGHKL